MNIMLYPGSFDPITYGHIDVIERASKMCDTLYVAILQNVAKKYTFSEQERLTMLIETTKHVPNIKCVIGSGLTIDFASRIKANAIVRGIRAVMDYEYELQSATANMKLNPAIETIFLISDPIYSYVSSSAVKEIAFHKGSISHIVPPLVEKMVKEHYA